MKGLNSNEVMNRCVLIDKEYLKELHVRISYMEKEIEKYSQKEQLICCGTCGNDPLAADDSFKNCIGCVNYSNWRFKE